MLTRHKGRFKIGNIIGILSEKHEDFRFKKKTQVEFKRLPTSSENSVEKKLKADMKSNILSANNIFRMTQPPRQVDNRL